MQTTDILEDTEIEIVVEDDTMEVVVEHSKDSPRQKLRMVANYFSVSRDYFNTFIKLTQ